MSGAHEFINDSSYFPESY